MKKENKQNKFAKGFTLIELLVVVLIIGIIAAIALPQYRKAVAKAELAQLLGVVKSFTTSLRGYYLANNSFPPNTVNGKNGINLLDISIEDENTKCIITGTEETLTYLMCHNKNFCVWVNIYNYGSKTYIERIGTSSVQENNALSNTAKDFFGENLNSCFSGSDVSSVCNYLGVQNCFTCSGKKYL